MDPEEPVPVEVALPTPAPSHSNGNGHPQLQIASAIRTLRQRSGLSQRQLALRMQVPRTYVSKIENEKAMPTLSSLQRLARALQVRVPDLLNGGTRTQQDEIRELIADPFIAELIPYVSKLNAMQCSSILSQIRDMTTRLRKSS